MFFNKYFYEMLSKIKVYQSETASRSLSQNSPSCCTPGCLFTKGSLLILTSRCHVCLHAMFVYIHAKCSGLTGWMVWPSKPTKLIKKKAVWLVFSAH